MSSIYGSIDLDPKILKESYDQSLRAKKSYGMESAQVINDSHDYQIQNNLRPLFGKEKVNTSPIGGHPHFDHLEKSGETSYGFATTLFIDIQGSTRLGVFYPPELVFYIKNQIIKCAIETILAFDGHVHRIMGDAVLAFFRSDGINKQNSAIDAVNCGTILAELIREQISPQLKMNRLEEDVGIRIGIDYGPDDRVIWGMYGYTGVSEVTATSFHVDIAAKLQQSAPRNRVMLGQSIVELLGFDEAIIEPKLIQKDGIKKTAPFVKPNYKDSDGNQVNYQQFVVSQEKYARLLPNPTDSHNPIKITSTLKECRTTPSHDHYHKCSRAAKKNYGITFKAVFEYPGAPTNLKVKFRVENNGHESKKKTNNENHENLVPTTQLPDGRLQALHWEETKYKGLHYMFVSVLHDGNTKIDEHCFAVYIG